MFLILLMAPVAPTLRVEVWLELGEVLGALLEALHVGYLHVHVQLLVQRRVLLDGVVADLREESEEAL